MTKKEPTIKDVRRILRKMDPTDPDADKRESSIILMSAAMVGAKERALVDFTGLPRSRVRELLRRGRDQRIFTRDGKLRVEWADGGGNSGIAFLCDVLVLDGLFARA